MSDAAVNIETSLAEARASAARHGHLFRERSSMGDDAWMEHCRYCPGYVIYNDVLVVASPFLAMGCNGPEPETGP